LGAIDYPPSTFDPPGASKPEWIRDSYQLLASGVGTYGPYRDQIKAVSWWDESFWQGATTNPPAPAYLQNNSIASSPASVDAYQKAVSNPLSIQYL
jgi:hypothetical protein